MAKLISKSLTELLPQSKYASLKQRIMQIDACEALVRLIRPGKSYPFDFVCFHLTGYRPKRKANPNLISYQTLLSDLPAYAESLSRTIDQKSTEAAVKVYTVKALAKRFRVCQRTISRWRERGLIGRYFVFSDRVKRIGFLASSVDYFVGQNLRKVQAGKRFSQVTQTQREEIVHRLIRWSQFCPTHRQEALRRTAKRYRRSIETVRRILQDYESSPSGTQLFAKRPCGMSAQEQGKIFMLYERRVELANLMQRFGRSRSNIYWAIQMERAARLRNLQIHYMHSDEFEQEKNSASFIVGPDGLFESTVMESSHSKTKLQKNQQIPSGPWDPGVKNTHAAKPIGLLETYVKDVKHDGLLNKRQERFLFRKYNYLKYEAKTLQEQLGKKNNRLRLITRMRLCLAQAKHLRERLIRCNLGLVLSASRKHTRSDAEMLDLVSEGNMALMNAVEKFDYTRDIKFSTYATWAIMKRFASFMTAKRRHMQYLIDDELLEVAHDLRVNKGNVAEVESARRSLDEIMDDILEWREKVIVREHYGLANFEKLPGKRKAKSFNQIGTTLGLSKERVRQIELVALNKLRRLLPATQFELLLQG